MLKRIYSDDLSPWSANPSISTRQWGHKVQLNRLLKCLHFEFRFPERV